MAEENVEAVPSVEPKAQAGSNNGPDFGQTIEKGIKAPWKHKALWFYGVLLAIFATGGSYNSGTQNLGNVNPNQMTGFVNGLPTSTWIMLGAILGIVVLVFVFIGLIVGSWSLAAIINGNARLEKGEEITRKEIGQTGKAPIWGLVKLNFFIPLLIVLIVAVVIGLLVGLGFAIPQPAGAIIGFAIGGLLFLVAIPFLVYYGIVWIMAARFVVMENQKAFESIKSARGLLKGNWWMTFLLSFVSGIISGCGGCLGSVVFIIFLIATIGFAVAKLYVVAAVMGVLAFVGLIILLIVAGYFRAFTESTLTIWWLGLKDSKK